MIAIGIGAGGQDAQGAQRGKEYDTVSGVYTQFVEREVLPLVEKSANVKLTKNPEGRATMGLSERRGLHHGMVPSRPLSPGAGLFADHGEPAMAVRSVAARRGMGVSQPWAGLVPGKPEPALNVKLGVVSTAMEPPGAPLIPRSPVKPIRFWFQVGDQDLFYPNPANPDGMHDWTLSSARMAKVLADKGYHYQYLFTKNAKHVDRRPSAQTLPTRSNGCGRATPQFPPPLELPVCDFPLGVQCIRIRSAICGGCRGLSLPQVKRSTPPKGREEIRICSAFEL